MTTGTTFTGVPGPISGMPTFSGALSGAEYFPLVAPPFGVPNSNQKILSSNLQTAIIPSGGTAQVFIGQGAGVLPSFKTIALDLTVTTAGTATVVGLQGRALSSAAPATSNLLRWNGATWLPSIQAPLPVTATATPYAVSTASAEVYVNIATTTVINLPDAATWLAGSAGITGLPMIIKDISGAADANHITINRAGTDTIDGLSSLTIATRYGGFSLRVPSSSGNWAIVG